VYSVPSHFHCRTRSQPHTAETWMCWRPVLRAIHVPIRVWSRGMVHRTSVLKGLRTRRWINGIRWGPISGGLMRRYVDKRRYAGRRRHIVTMAGTQCPAAPSDPRFPIHRYTAIKSEHKTSCAHGIRVGRPAPRLSGRGESAAVQLWRDGGGRDRAARRRSYHHDRLRSAFIWVGAHDRHCAIPQSDELWRVLDSSL
jgi:hypothetical protein